MLEKSPDIVKSSLLISLFIISLSFLEGWFFDASKPVSGSGWADQSMYKNVAAKLADGVPLSQEDFHYQIGYSLLGAVVTKIIPSADPFSIISFSLLWLSIIFCYYGAKYHFNAAVVIVFLAFLFFREGDVRQLYYAQEIFLIPWNNQVLFFCFSVLFWAFSKTQYGAGSLSTTGLILVSAVCGYTVTTREESVIFILPAMALLIWSKRDLKTVAGMGVAFFLFVSPNFIFKYAYFDSLVANVRPSDEGVGYIDKVSSYMSAPRLLLNLLDVIWDSSLRGVQGVNRDALLQRSFWLILAPLGLALFFIKSGFKNIFSGYLVISLALFVFYLAGENMNIQKIKFHCIRYITPSFIALSFCSVYLINESFSKIVSIFQQYLGQADKVERGKEVSGA